MEVESVSYGFSVTGKRKNNEDHFCIETIQTLNDSIKVLAVADGMGGMAAGEIASKTAVQTLLEQLKIELQKSQYPKTALKLAGSAIQNKIRSLIASDAGLAGMGTTLTVAIIYEQNKLVYGNLGDSRIYRIFNDEIDLLTKDHSFIQQYRDENNGELPDYLKNNYSNLLTKSFDGGKDALDTYPFDKDYFELQDGTLLVLCSDGLILNELNEEEEFKRIILQAQNIEDAARDLLNNALLRGSKDNITVAIYEFGRHNRYPDETLKTIEIIKGHVHNRWNRISRKGYILIVLATIILISFLFLLSHAGTFIDFLTGVKKFIKSIRH